MTGIRIQAQDHFWEKIGLILISGALYSITIASIDVAAGFIPPFTLTTLRLITALILWSLIFCFLRPKIALGFRIGLDIFIIGLLTVAIPFLSLAMAVKYISSSLASILFNLQPVFTVALAHLMFVDEKLNLAKVIGIISAITGATLLLVLKESGLSTDSSYGWVGQLFILIASLSGAVGVVAVRIRLQSIDPPILAASLVFVSLIIIGPLALALEGLPTLSSYHLNGWIAMILAAVSAPVAAYWIMFHLIRKFSASLAGFSGITTPLFSILIGMFFLGDTITLPIIIGAIFLLAAVWFLHYF